LIYIDLYLIFVNCEFHRLLTMIRCNCCVRGCVQIELCFEAIIYIYVMLQGVINIGTATSVYIRDSIRCMPTYFRK